MISCAIRTSVLSIASASRRTFAVAGPADVRTVRE